MTNKAMMRSSSALSALALMAAGGAGAAAQETQGGEQPQTQSREVIVVTGSLIRGTPVDAALPVQVISADELLRQGSPSPVELIKNLSVSAGVIGDTNQFDTRAQSTEGMSSVNLRGLSPQRTLVLLNSRRLVPSGNGVPIVDMNLMPHAALGRIEILKDGAAATYGSDAVGGVVNFITRTDQHGAQAAADYTFIDGSDGDFTISGSFGQVYDNFRFLVAGGIQRRSELLASQRDFAVRPYEDNPEGGWTGGGNPASFLTLGPTGAPNTGVRADPDCEALGGYVTALNRCATQYTPFDALVEDEDRGQVFAQAAFRLGDTMELEVSGLFGQTVIPYYRSSPSYLLTQPPSTSVGGSPSGFVVPATNPGFQRLVAENPGFVPPGTVAALFPTLLFRPFLAGGNPMFDGRPDDLQAANGRRVSESYWFNAALTGSVTDTVDFDLSYTYHRYDRYYDGYDSFGDRVQLALLGLGGSGCNPATGTPGQGACQWLNPFGNAVGENNATGDQRPGGAAVPNSGDLARWFFVKSWAQIDTTMNVVEGSVSGESGWSLGGGPVMFAAGAQYRSYTFDAVYGPNNNLAVTPCRDTPVTGNTQCTPRNGALGFLGANENSSLSNDVWATFGELHLPVTDAIEVQLAARYEDYGGDTGSTFDPKATVRWQAAEGLAFRGTAGTTFRGPPTQQISDRNVTSLQVIANSFRPVDVFGNPGLAPESAFNWSVGAMANWGGFSATVDYFRYEIEDAILVEPLAGMVSTLFASPGNCADPAFAGLRERFQFNDGGGVPGAGTCAAENIARVRTEWINGGDVTSSGIDFTLNYDVDDVFGGRFGLGLSGTYALEYEVGDEFVEGVLVQPAFEAVGRLNFQTNAYPVPEWKWRAWLDWSRGIVSTRLTVNHTDGYRDQRADAGVGPFRPREDIAGSPVLMQGADIGSYTTYDANLIVDVRENVRLSLTGLNLTDQDPPLARLDYNYDPFTGNPLGRIFRVGVSAAF